MSFRRVNRAGKVSLSETNNPFLCGRTIISDVWETEMRLFKPEDMEIPVGAQVGALQTDDRVTLRYAVWEALEANHRGTISIFTGIPETIEQYFETVNDLRERGFAVAIMDWRSQGGSQRPLRDIGKVHVHSFDDYRRDFDAFVRMVSERCQPPHYSLAHSGGALISLYAMASRAHCFDRAIAMAPAMRSEYHGYPGWLISGAGFVLVSLGMGGLPYQKFQAGKALQTAHEPVSASGHMTDDPVRSERYWKAYLLDPSLFSNQRTIAWFLSYFRVADQVTADDFGPSIDIPVLITRGSSDHIAPVEPIMALIRRLPSATYFEIPGARHVVLQESDEVRSCFWGQVDKFLP